MVLHTVYLLPKIPFGNQVLHLSSESSPLEFYSAPPHQFAIFTNMGAQHGSLVRVIPQNPSLRSDGKSRAQFIGVDITDRIGVGDIKVATHKELIANNLSDNELSFLFKQRLQSVLTNYAEQVDAPVYSVSPHATWEYALLLNQTDGDDGEPLPLRCVA